MVRHILCPTDFSEACQGPLEQAMRLAASLEARLTVLHVIHDPAFVRVHQKHPARLQASLVEHIGWIDIQNTSLRSHDH